MGEGVDDITYFLMDLDRTIANGVPAYWKANRHGYTYHIEFAGIFSKENAELIVNNDRDKTTIMIPVDTVAKILMLDLKQHEGF
jgi:hypothetical protein